MGRGAAISDRFDAIMGSRRGVRDWDKAHGLEYPKTIGLRLKPYGVGSMDSGVAAFDEQTNALGAVITPVRAKVGASLREPTINGTHVRKMRAASRPPGPNNPTAMRKRDLLRLVPGVMTSSDEWFAAGDAHVLAFIEEITETMPIKVYLLFHEEDGTLATHAYFITDENDYFLQSFGDGSLVLDACAPYLARRP